DEFVELYNATAQTVVLDNKWTLEARASGGASYTTRWSGAGLAVPAYHHFLIVGGQYSQAPPADSQLQSGITDAASVVLKHSGAVVDAVCFCYDIGTCQAVVSTGFVCEGSPAMNFNMDAAPGIDVSLERLAGGKSGSCL